MMKAKLCSVVLLGLLSTSAMGNDNLTIDSAIGGAVGGAVGGALGAEVGGRDGAIIGAGVGAAAGTAIFTSGHDNYDYRDYRYTHGHYRTHGSGFCPPGQAKKGRC